MAVGDSQTSICNIGLIELGQDPLTSIDDNCKAAILCRARWDSLRREMLAERPWNCAKKQAVLAAKPESPLFSFANAFPLPADFLGMVNLPDNDMAQWEIVGSDLYTDEAAPLKLLYIFDLQDVTRFTPLLSKCLGFSIGAALAMPLTQDKKLRDQLTESWHEMLATAASVSSQQNSPVEWDVDVALRSRR